MNNNRSSYIAPNSNILTNQPIYKQNYTNQIDNNMQNQNTVIPTQIQPQNINQQPYS